MKERDNPTTINFQMMGRGILTFYEHYTRDFQNHSSLFIRVKTCGGGKSRDNVAHLIFYYRKAIQQA